VGGLADGELRVAGATYADFEFWPGPLDPATGRPPDPEDCSEYDRIWRVSRHDVAEYYRTGTATRDLAEWPFHLGAPVIDADGDSTNYDLAAGDQPAISGDQMLWWVMNDVGNSHNNSLVPPIGLEVHTSVFGFGGGPPAIHQSTFYRYRLVNHGQTLDSAYVTLFADTDLGDAADDYVGSDSVRGMGFTYNADNADGTGGGTTYGSPPPAFGVHVVRGLGPAAATAPGRAGARGGMSSFLTFFSSGFPQSDPADGRQMYFMMQGRWTDGSPVTRGGSGLNPGSSDTTRFMFSGNPLPPRFWSERCPASPHSCGAPTPPNDRRFLVSTGPGRLNSGAAEELLIALVFGWGADHLDSIIELRSAADVGRNSFDAGMLAASRVPGFVEPELPLSVELRRPAPNPFSGEAVIGITLPARAAVRAAVYDVLGREVAVLADGPRDAGANDLTLAGAGLAPGVYVVRVWVNGQPAGALPVTRR
jgi:hypothetical protein